MSASRYQETQKIEFATAEGFFSLYNVRYQTTYAITCVAGDGEVPDVLAKDNAGKSFNLEITLTEDRPFDIKAMLGRSEHRSIQALKSHLEAVREGREKLRMTSLSNDALPMLLNRMDKKLVKHYGPNTALVIRDTSPLWNWEAALSSIRGHLLNRQIPFDLGIWLLSLDKASLLKIHP